MEFQDLKMFHAAARMGTISGAARELGYVQSNVTARIQRLEEELQSRLFHRHSRGVSLTPRGRVLFDCAERVLLLMEETAEQMRAAEGPRGPLSIGAMESTAAVRLPGLLSAYHRRFPEVELSLLTDTSEGLIRSVLDRRLDGAFVGGPVHHPDVAQRLVVEEELVWIRGQENGQADPDRLRTILLFGKGCAYRARAEAWLRAEGLMPYRILEFGAVETILGCVRAGMGLGVVARSVAEQLLSRREAEPSVSIRPLPDRFARVPTVFIHRSDTGSPNLMAWKELVEETFTPAVSVR